MLNDLRTRLATMIRPKALGASVLPLWWESYGGASMSSFAGLEVSPRRAFRCTPIYAAVKVLAESVAQLPFHLYSKDDRGARDREIEHPVAHILTDAANEYMTAFEFRQQMMVDVLLWGNAYAYLIRDSRGYVTELWPIPSEMVAVELDMETLAPLYRVTMADNRQRVLGRGDILHLKTIGARHHLGESPIMMNRDAIALTIAMEEHASRMFGSAPGHPAFSKPIRCSRQKP